jgi:hypothetical protein
LGEPANDLIDVLMRQRIATVKMDAKHAKPAKPVQSHEDLLTGQLIAHGRMAVAIATGQIAQPRDFEGQGQGRGLDSRPGYGCPQEHLRRHLADLKI